MLGLPAAPEDGGGTIRPARRSQVEATGMFSMRAGDLLEATLQVSRLRDEARFRTAKFQAQVVSEIGSSLPHRTRLGGMDGYLTTRAPQRGAVWVKGRCFFIPSLPDDL